MIDAADNSVLYVTHNLQDGISVCFGPGDHTVTRKRISATKALCLIEDLTKAVRAEMKCEQP